MTLHNEQHEELLLDLFVGDRHEDDTDILRLLAACSECRTKVESLQFITSRLDEVGAEQSQDLSSPCLQSEKSVQAELERMHNASPGPKAVSIRRPWIQWVAMAAASIGVFFMVRALAFSSLSDAGHGAQQRQGLTLGAEPESGKQPLSIHLDEGNLVAQWSSLNLAGGSFQLWIYDAADGELWTSGRLSETQCVISLESLGEQPDGVLFELQAFDASSKDVGELAQQRFYFP